MGTADRAAPVPGRAASPATVPSVHVTAVVVVRDATTLVAVLDAVAGSERRPDRLVVADLSGGAASDAARAHARCRRLLADDDLLDLEPGLQLLDALERVAAHLGPAAASTDPWWWLLVDDALPHPGALGALLAVLRRGPERVGAVGPTLVQTERPDRLVQSGYQVSPWGRAAPAPVPGELDQGQYRDRTDVLGVPLTGALLRARAWRRAGGLDPALSGDELALATAGLDLGWRLHRTGQRVLVSATARVGVGPTMAAELSPDGAWRSRVRRIALARTPMWRAVPAAVLVLLSAPFLALLCLLTGRGGAAAGRRLREAVGALGLGLAPGPRLRFLRASRGVERVPHPHLRGLFLPAFARLLEPRGAASAAPVGGDLGDGETGPVAEDAEVMVGARPGRRFPVSPGLLVVLLVLAGTVAGLRDWFAAGVLSPSGGAGGEVLLSAHVRPLATDASGLWHAFVDGWHGAGLGEAAPREPWWGLLAAPTLLGQGLLALVPAGPALSPASLTLAWLLFLTPALAAVSAYLATRGLRAGRWVRAGVALLWAAQPLVWDAVGQARVGAAALAVLAPVLVAGVIGVSRRGNLPTLAGTVLVATLLAATAPGVAVAGSVLALVLCLVHPGWAWARLLTVAALPWVLLGPWVVSIARDPRLLLSGPGLSTTSTDSVWDLPPWRLALGDLASGGLAPASAATGVLVALAVLGLLRPGRPGRRSGWLVLGAVLLLVAALGTRHIGLGPADQPGSDAAGDTVLLPWPGTFVLAAYALLVPAAAAGLQALAQAVATRRPALARTGAALLAVVVVGGAGLTAPALAAAVPGVSGAAAPLPPAARELAASGFATRVLVLEPDADGQGDVRYALQGSEPGRWLRDAVVDSGPRTGTAAGSLDLAAPVVAALLDPAGSADPVRAHRGVLGLAVGHVVLDAPAGDPLEQVLDRAPGLRRVADPTPGSASPVWRVLPAGSDGTGAGVEGAPPARVAMVDQAGHPVAAIPVAGPHAATAEGGSPLPARPPGSDIDPADLRLRVSEAPAAAAHLTVRVDGTVLRPLPTADSADDLAAAATLTYPLPPDWAQGDRVSITVEQGAAPWPTVQAAGLGLLLLLALPLLRPRREERR